MTTVLFDFGGTLADEHWMRATHPPFPGFADAYHRARRARVDEWDLGRVSTAELAGAIAHDIDVDPTSVREHIRILCRQLQFFEAGMTFARERRARDEPQALVTVNPDLFADVVAHYRLDEIFDPIVVSSTEGTTDKLALCDVALEMLGTSIEDAVLIDDVVANVEAYRAAGGRSYHFVDDLTFATDLGAGRVV